eukprot:6071930-Prymnesium_polylepis.2
MARDEAESIAGVVQLNPLAASKLLKRTVRARPHVDRRHRLRERPIQRPPRHVPVLLPPSERVDGAGAIEAAKRQATHEAATPCSDERPVHHGTFHHPVVKLLLQHVAGVQVHILRKDAMLQEREERAQRRREHERVLVDKQIVVRVREELQQASDASQVASLCAPPSTRHL